VQVAIEQLMATIGTDAKIDKLNRELLGLEETSYKYVEADYRDGKIAYLDLVTSLNDLLDARIRSCSSIYSLAQDLAQYRYYEGNLYDTLAE
jgi:outer membrane protein TolC